MMNYYNIAGLIVQMDTFGRTERLSELYVMNETPKSADIVIESDRSHYQTMHPLLTEEEAEYLASGASFHKQILRFDALMLHSSAVAVNGKAYLFTANCGVGKSTHTSLWRSVFGEEHVVLINDDKPVLRFEDGEWFVYGTPWSGKNGLNENVKVPIGAICLLNRGEINEIVPGSGTVVLRALLAQTPKPKDSVTRMMVLGLLDKLITHVPIWKLKCNMDPEAAIVAYEAMSGEKWEDKK